MKTRAIYIYLYSRELILWKTALLELRLRREPNEPETAADFFRMK